MNIKNKISDNITEVLTRIVEFTDRRNKLIKQNIANANSDNYTPTDLDDAAFADLMANAVAEHISSNRLLLIDSENFKFGPEGKFESFPVPDYEAKKLLASDTKLYIKHQLKKMSENILNKKIASKMLLQKQRKHSKLNT